MANNRESKPTVSNEKESTLTDETTSGKEEDVWFCYLATTDTSPPDMAGDTTTTETWHCTWYNL